MRVHLDPDLPWYCTLNNLLKQKKTTGVWTINYVVAKKDEQYIRSQLQ